MTTRTRRLWAVSLAGGLALVLGRSWPGPGEVPPADADVAPAKLIVPANEIVPLRTLAKQAIAREVAAGRRRLLEAATLFGALNRLPPALLKYPPPGTINPDVPLPTTTEAECLCWQVVSWVRCVRQTRPGEADAVVARLVVEFEDVRRTRGLIQLPDPSAVESAEALIARIRASLTAPQRDALRQGRWPMAAVES
jgi:hypothetical protein